MNALNWTSRQWIRKTRWSRSCCRIKRVCKPSSSMPKRPISNWRLSCTDENYLTTSSSPLKSFHLPMTLIKQVKNKYNRGGYPKNKARPFRNSQIRIKEVFAQRSAKDVQSPPSWKTWIKLLNHPKNGKSFYQFNIFSKRNVNHAPEYKDKLQSLR